MELEAAERALRPDPVTGLPAVGAAATPTRAVLRALDRAGGDEATRAALVAQRLGLTTDEVVAVRTVAELRPGALEGRPSLGASLATFTPPVARWLEPAGRRAAASLAHRPAVVGALAATVLGGPEVNPGPSGPDVAPTR